MKKLEMEKLITFNHGKLMIEGYDLKEIADMYFLSVKDFLVLFEYYLKAHQSEINKNYIFNKNYNVPKVSSQYNGEILVEGEEYENMKKRIFDFAYTTCSNIAINNFGEFSMYCSDKDNLIEKIKKDESTYSCIYHSSRLGWYQKKSSIPIDEIDKEKRYSLIKR